MSKKIQVTYREPKDGEAAALTVEPEMLEIGPEPREPVVWSLQGLPKGASARLEWSSHLGGDPPLGPFTNLLYSEDSIVGRGDKGRSETHVYPYAIVIESAPGTADGTPAMRSEPCTLVATAARPSSTPNAVVAYAEGRLAVEPLMISVSTGNIVTWFFEGFPEDVYPAIRFVKDGPFGPFSALTLAATEITAEAGVTYIISGEVTSTASEPFFYILEARDRDHQVLAERHDPGIDNMGPPTWP